jgi:hypothetical protein
MVFAEIAEPGLSLPEGVADLSAVPVETPAVDLTTSAAEVKASVPEAEDVTRVSLEDSGADKKKGITGRLKGMFSRKPKTDVEAPSAALDAGTPEVTVPDVGVPEISAPEDAAASVSAAMAGLEVPSAVPDITAPGVEGAAAVDLPGTDVAAGVKTSGTRVAFIGSYSACRRSNVSILHTCTV